MHLTFERHACNPVLDPGDCAQRRVHSSHSHDNPIADLAKAFLSANLAAAFGDIDQININEV